MNPKSFKWYPIIARENFEYSLLLVLKWYWEAAIEDISQKYLNMCFSKWLIYKVYSPLNSHGFTVCHTVSLPFSRSHGRFFISHGFANFKWIFSQTHNFLRKQTRQHNPLSEKYCNIVFCIQKKNNSVIFDSETSTRSSPGNDCPVNYQNFYEKHPSSISLTKSVLFRDSFCNNLEIF